MHVVLSAVLPIFGLILLGFACARRGVLPAGAIDSLNGFVVWLALPALLFRTLAAIRWADIAHPGFVAAFVGGMAVVYALPLVLAAKPFRLADAGIEALAAAYPNTGFMGIPLCLAAFGPDSLPAASIAAVITVCVPFALSIVLVELGTQAEPDWRGALRAVAGTLARNPLLVSPVLGLAYAATGLAVPESVDRFLGLLAAAASPCALVAIGLFLADQRPAMQAGAVGRLVAFKLVLHPAVTGALAFWVFAMPPLWAKAAVLLSALPIGTGPFMLAKLYDREAAVTSRAILVSTVVSVATVSALVAWL